MRNCVQASSRTWITCNENQFTFFGAGGRPFEETRGMHRLIVFVDADERHINIEAREIEVVRIAAKESSLKLRHKHQPHVGIFLIAIKIVLTALVKRDN